MTANLKTLVPADIEFSKERNLEGEQVEAHYLYTKDMIPDSYIPLRETLEKMNYDIEQYLKDVVEFQIYRVESITVKETLGSVYEEALRNYPILANNPQEDFMKISDYNRIARLFSLQEYTLKDDEYLLIADFDSIAQIRNMSLSVHTPLTIQGKTYYPKYTKCEKSFVFMSSNHINSGIFLVPDEALDGALLYKEVLTANYKGESEEEKKAFEEVVLALENHPYNKKTDLSVTSKLSIYESSVGLGALVTFIGLYLGTIFLISSAAILALKELSESSDNKKRFQMLRNLGVDEREINMALFRQIFLFFLIPLILAVVHSIFGILFCNYILETFGTVGLLPSILMTSIFLLFIYGGYLWITYACSKNIIKERVV